MKSESISASDLLAICALAVALGLLSWSIWLQQENKQMKEQLSKPKNATIQQTITCN